MFIKLLIITIFAKSFASTTYDGYKVIELNLKSDLEISTFLNLTEKFHADIWKGPSKRVSTHVMLKSTDFNQFVNELEKASIRYKVIIENVQKLIDAEKIENHNFTLPKMYISYRTTVNDHFSSYIEIMKWIEYISKMYKFVSTGVYGKSYEGRDLRYVKLSTGSNRKSVLADGGIHAREWLAVSSITYMIEKMIAQYVAGNTKIVELLSKYDFYFIPVVNPDGYQFTHTNGNRLWRKNRKPHVYNGQICYGTDLNRNFDAKFGVSGTSSNPCDDIYRGPYPFSEPETKQFSNFVLKLKSNLKLYFSLHSYAQFWFVPYGFGRTLPSDDAELRRIANIGNYALYNVNGLKFYVGTPPELLYAAAGGAFDWVKMKAGIKYAYTLEVRPSFATAQGMNGFIAPISDIKKSGEEVYAGLIATVNAIPY